MAELPKLLNHAESESELLFETGSRNQGVSAHAQWTNGKNRLKIALFGLKSYLYRFSGMLNPNLGSFLKPEVEIRAFLRMRSGKNGKIGLKSRFRTKIRLL